MSKQQEEINKSINHTAKLVPQSQRDLFISEINQIIDIAVAEKQNILEMIIKDIQGFSPDGEIGTLCEQALSLITKEN